MDDAASPKITKNKKQIDTGRVEQNKEFLQVRISKKLKEEILEIAEEEGLTLSQYVIGLLEDSIDIKTRIFPYTVEENSITVTVDSSGKYDMKAEQHIVLNRDLEEYSYYVDFNREKVKRFLKERKSWRNLWAEVPSMLVFENGKNITGKQKFGDSQMYQTGGCFVVRFHRRTKGAKLKIQVKAAFNHYALSTKQARHFQERDKVLFNISEPTKVFNLHLKLSKKLFDHDKNQQRLTEKHIQDSMIYEVLDSRQVKIRENITNDPGHTHNFSRQRITGEKNEDVDFFYYDLRVDQPLWGLYYGISWVAPLSIDK